MQSLADRAEALLRSNDRGRHTVPSPHLYPHQWAWDSAFAAIGWATFDLDRAVSELEMLMEGQWDDGRVPHIAFHDLEADYFPGPDFWETERSSSISQPPAWAIAARRLHERGADPERLRALLPAMERSHAFFLDARDPEGWGAVSVVHPWESGLDNSPAWDEPLRAVDPSRAPEFKRVDKDRVDDAGQRPTDDEYARFAVLVKDIARDGFGQGGFCVYDPLMTSILARAEADLAWLASELDVPTEATSRRQRLLDGLNQLWNEELGRHVFYDAIAQRPVTPNVLASYMALTTQAEGERADRLRAGLRAGFATPWPLPSTSPSDPGFDARRYWRGPTWINMNWLLAPAVRGDLVKRTLGLVERSGFREYYNPQTGEGLGARDFTWTAALVLDWLRP